MPHTTGKLYRSKPGHPKPSQRASSRPSSSRTAGRISRGQDRPTATKRPIPAASRARPTVTRQTITPGGPNAASRALVPARRQRAAIRRNLVDQYNQRVGGTPASRARLQGGTGVQAGRTQGTPSGVGIGFNAMVRRGVGNAILNATRPRKRR